MRWLSLLLVLAGCDDHLLAHTRRGAVDCDRTPPLSWDNFGEGRMEVLCTGCHSSLLSGPRARNGAPDEVDLDTLSGVATHFERVWIRTIEERTMPPGGGLPEDDLAVLEEWLVCDVESAAMGWR